MDFETVNEGQSRDILAVNTMLDGIPVFYLGAAITVLGVGFAILIKLGFLMAVVFIALTSIGILLVFGRNPSKQMERVGKPTKYMDGRPSLKFDNVGMPVMAKAKKTDPLRRIQDNFCLKTYGQFEFEGVTVGFHLHHWNSRDAKIGFMFDVVGLDPTVTPAQSKQQLNKSNQKICHLGQTDLKAILDIRADCSGPLIATATSLGKSTDALTTAQLQSDAENLQSLEAEGRIAKSRLLYQAKCRLRLGGDYDTPDSPADVVFEWVSSVWNDTVAQKMMGDAYQSKEQWEKAIFAAYNNSYKRMTRMLTGAEGLGHKIQPLTAQELFDWDYAELHEESIPIPQYTRYDDLGLDPNCVISEHHLHSLGVLFEPEKGKPAVPQFNESLAYLPSKGKFVGALRFEGLRTISEVQDSTELGFIKFLFDTLATPGELFLDARVVTELLPIKSGLTRAILEQTGRNSIRKMGDAAKRKELNPIALERLEETKKNLEWMNNGNRPFWVACAIFLYRDTVEQLNLDLDALAQKLEGTKAVKITQKFEHHWCTSLAISAAPMLTLPGGGNHLYKTMSPRVRPTLPQIHPAPMDRRGVMLLGHDLPIPFYLDLAHTFPNHTLATGETGVGKTMLMLEMTSYCQRERMNVVGFDFPPPTGKSSYEPYMATQEQLNVSSTYQPVDKATINVMETPDVSWIDDLPKPGEPGYDSQQPTREEAWKFIKRNKLRILKAIALGEAGQSDPMSDLLIERTLGLCFEAFHQANLERYTLASTAPFGSEEAAQMPIYEEFVAFSKVWLKQYIQDNDCGPDLKQTFENLQLLLEGVIPTALGSSINGISSFDSNVDALMLGLTNVDNNSDSLVYGVAGFDLLIRKAMNGKRTLLPLDEGSELLTRPIFAEMVGSLANSGRKWQCNILIGMTEVKTLLNSSCASKVISNLQNKFVSHVNEYARKQLVSEFGFQADILQKFEHESFRASKSLQQSHWCWQRGSRQLIVTHNPSNFTLGVGANQGEQTKARNRVMSRYPGDPVTGLVDFGNQLSQANKKGIEVETIGVENHAA